MQNFSNAPRCRSNFYGNCVSHLLMIGLAICLASDVQAQSPKSSTVKKKSKSKGKPAANQTAAPEIADYSSKNFLVHTDLPQDEAQELIEKLEKMLRLVSAYYGKPNGRVIEMNVVHDRSMWPAGSIPDDAINSIEQEAGITLTLTQMLTTGFGDKHIIGAKSVVWARDHHGIPQHEAVHAYCHQTFGRTGPTWYSEGMAEIGKYWNEVSVGVKIDEYVLEYLKETEPEDLEFITALDQRTGDSWQNYAWRWALCYLLSANPNYAPRFKPLGMGMLNGDNVSFEDVYGSMAREIEFEYLFFLKHIDQGYRCDLCAWDWKTKFVPVKSSTGLQVKVAANRGWQATRLQLKKGDKITYTASGEWSLEKKGRMLTANGDDDGKGRLVAVLFEDYQLSEPFELGEEGEYEASESGNLFVRCQDDWTQIADNGGSISVKFKAAK